MFPPPWRATALSREEFLGTIQAHRSEVEVTGKRSLLSDPRSDIASALSEVSPVLTNRLAERASEEKTGLNASKPPRVATHHSSAVGPTTSTGEPATRAWSFRRNAVWKGYFYE